MPRSESYDRELTEEELDTVVGGTKEVKLLMENWRRFLNEQEEEATPPKPKAIYMAGGPGSGKSTVLKGLGLKGEMPIINADAQYEAGLKSAGLSLGGKPEVYTRIKKLQAELETNPDDEEKQAELASEKEKMSQYAKIFNKAQASKKVDIKKYSDPADGDSQNFVVDGTAGNYKEMVREKERLEAKGYDVAMVFVDLDIDTAIERNRARGKPDPKTGIPGRQLLDRELISSHEAVKKNKEAYESLFGKNFFYVNAAEDKMGSDISKIKPGVDTFLSADQLEEGDWQKDVVIPNYNKQLKNVLRHGGNKTKAKPFGKKARIDYRGSAPPNTSGG